MYKPNEIHHVCVVAIPEALGLTTCLQERAHRLGPFQMDRKGPRPVISRYLNYAEKAQILKSFHNQRNLTIYGHALLMFADYSIEVSRKCKAFSKVCTLLHERQIHFSLGYPAVLYLTSQNGCQHVFQDPAEAKTFVALLQDESLPEGALPLQQQNTRSNPNRSTGNS